MVEQDRAVRQTVIHPGSEWTLRSQLSLLAAAAAAARAAAEEEQRTERAGALGLLDASDAVRQRE